MQNGGGGADLERYREPMTQAHFAWTKAETFEKRTAMAERVRLRMLENDSKNCRTCHHMEAITPMHKRGERAHAGVVKEGRTNCIVCHYNLGHKEAPLTPAFSQAIKSQAVEVAAR